MTHKHLFIFSLFFFLTSTLANTSSAMRKVEFWCSPDDPSQGVEAVLVTRITNKINLEIYTKGARWGSVSVRTLSAELENSIHYTYKSLNHKAELTLYHDGITPSVPGFIYDANFSQEDTILNSKMYCEYLP